MPYGKIEPFDMFSGQWSLYVRRVEQFILLNDIKDSHKVATLVTLVGDRTYNLMCDLCAPNNPEDKSFKELVEIVKRHLEPQRSKYAEREIFRQHKQNAGESIGDFLQHLKHLAATCNFGQYLEENLCEQFVTGLCSTEIKSRLLFDSNLTYKKAVELALGLEAAEKHVERMSGRSSIGGALSENFGRREAAGGARALGGERSGGGDGAAAGEGLHALRGAAGRRPGPQAAPPLQCWRCELFVINIVFVRFISKPASLLATFRE
ncbi:uncharacterized protein [Epargyreus clarus]|uniref:uncharacterized protein n=1 Tax=Epargyreus clarus TaxID=520877 RepID=UPI003C2B5EA3